MSTAEERHRTKMKITEERECTKTTGVEKVGKVGKAVTREDEGCEGRVRC